MNLKIRDKVIAIMVILIIIPIILLGWSSYKTSSDALTKQYNDLGKVIGQEATLVLESKIENINRLVEDISKNPALNNLQDEATLNGLINSFNRTKETYDFLDIYFGSTEGNIYIASGADTTGVVATERPWYIKATENENAVWSEMYEDALTGEKAITVSRAVYNGDTLLGVVGIDINLTDFSKDILSVDIMGGHPIVIDSEGTIIIDKFETAIGQPFEAKGLFKDDVDEVQAAEYTYENKETKTSQDQLIVYTHADGSDWNVATIIGMDELAKLNKNMLKNIMLIGLITILVAVLIAIVFGKNIANSINEVLNVIRKMESGDFTARINTRNTDEFGELRDRFNNMLNTLGSFIGKIKTASGSVDEYSGNLAAIAEEVSASSLEVSTTAEEIARGASNQADDTEKGVSLICNLSDKLTDLDNTSTSMVDLTDEIRKTSDDSTEVVRDLKEKTTMNNESSERVEREIVELDRRIGGVTDILSTIDQISEQTNLLALNASIEAARAGEYGKGFAVVADEIRKLAAESKESSNNIKNILEAVQSESKHTVLVVQEVSKRNEEQNEAVNRVSESFTTIGDLIEEIVGKISEINEKSTQMNIDKDDIVRSIENISAISEQTAAASQEVTASIEQQTSATEEVASSASKLNELSNELNNEISVFKV